MEFKQLALEIIIVEDNQHKLEKIKSLIKTIEIECNIYTADNFIDGCQLLTQVKSDLLILDMKFPLRKNEEINENNGKLFLDEIDNDSSYNIPKYIVLLSEFDESIELAKTEIGEIISIKFDMVDSSWKEKIEKTINRLYKSKNNQDIICYAEGKNNIDLNKLNLNNIKFISANNSRAIFLNAVNEPLNMALRDKDFLTSCEVQKLCKKYPNYRILKFYCFENYLYHPDNIEEAYPNFDKEGYINDLIYQKNEKLLFIIQDYKKTRESYEDLKNIQYGINICQNIEEEIFTSLKSDEINVFFKFFDLAGKSDQHKKKSYNLNFLMKYNLDKNKLIKTNWLKENFREILSPS